MFEETTFAFVEDAPCPGSEVARRDTTGLDNGVAITGNARNVCFVRRLTGGGATLQIDFDVEIGDRLSLELGSGQCLEGVVAWRLGSEAGLKFDRPVDVFAIITRNMVSMPAERRRMPRIEIDCTAYVEAPGGAEMARARDVSHGGVKLQTGLRLNVGESVKVTLDGLFPLDGRVAWTKDGLAGIAFEPEPGWQELMPWLREVRTLCARRPGPPPESAPSQPRHPAMARLDDRAGDGVQLNMAARVREGTRRWNIEVRSLTAHGVEFESYSPIRIGTLLWIVLPGLQGWSGRVEKVEGQRFTCSFTHPLHAVVLERIFAAAAAGD